ncbi:MAG: helix-turn-helix domain-containing protein [Bacteroidales bacterium]|nr:helix-turn-helix domain-containing protein [Bacteroidales bacterium]
MNAEITVSRTGLYNITQASEILGIHRNTLRKYIRLNLIPTHRRKATGQTIIQGTDIILFFNRRTR